MKMKAMAIVASVLTILFTTNKVSAEERESYLPPLPPLVDNLLQEDVTLFDSTCLPVYDFTMPLDDSEEVARIVIPVQNLKFVFLSADGERIIFIQVLAESECSVAKMDETSILELRIIVSKSGNLYKWINFPLLQKFMKDKEREQEERIIEI